MMIPKLAQIIKNILVLLRNDLGFAFKNKTFYLILFIPLFVFASLKLTDQIDPNANKMKIGLIQNYGYPPVIIESISAAETIFTLSWITNVELGKELLKQGQLDGILIWNETITDSLALLVLKKSSLQTSSIMQNITDLQRATEGMQADWISEIASVYQGDAQREILPTWVLMLVLLSGFIILPMQVAEEKEKKLLLALLQTPIHEIQWLIAKLLLGVILIITAVVVLHVLGQFGPVQLFDYIIFILIGSYCFSAYGIFLGFLCRTQAGARTLGVIFFLPHLLPSVMGDVSAKLTAVAPLLPSYQLFHPLQSILLEGGKLAHMPFDLAYLFLLGTLLFYFSYLLMKRRWMM